MPLTRPERDTFDRLTNDLAQRETAYDRLDGYYEGQQRLEQLGLAIPPDLRKFVVIVNWPRLGVDSVEERLDVEGFRYPDTDEADRELWRVWQANDLDEESQLAHLDALIVGRSFAAIGTNERDSDTPLVTVESPREVVAERDPRTRQLTNVLRLYDTPDGGGAPQKATLYLPAATVWLERKQGRWDEVDRDKHGLGLPPVVELVNRPRTANRVGVSEMADLIPITDAAARSLTNLQLAQETHAVPQRGVLGATKGDFVDADNKPLPVWEAYFGAIWALQNKEAKTFQFDASDLKNFDTTMTLYARQASALTGLPPHYLGFTTENPASAEAIRSSESRLVKRCERKQRFLGGSWEQVQRIVRRIQTGSWDPRLLQLETQWRDPSTPTKAQAADAVVKLVGQGILPVPAAWEDLGYSETRQQNLKRMREQEMRQVLSLGDDLLDREGA